MFDLSWAKKGMWCGLLSLAQQCNADGYLIKGPGLPMSLEDIATCLHISTQEDQKTLAELIDQLVQMKCAHWNSKSLVITHFAERQALAPSDTKEAIKDRVQRYREKQKAVTEKSLQPQLSLSPTPPITKDKEGEGEEEGNGGKVVTTHKNEPSELNQLVKKVFEGLKDRRGVPSPQATAEATAIRWMLKYGFTVEQILESYDRLKEKEFWSQKFLSMQSLKSQISELIKSKQGQKLPPGKIPTNEEVIKGWNSLLKKS
jgi:hypothetical protein